MMIGESRWCEELQGGLGRPMPTLSVLEHQSGYQLPRAAVSALVSGSAAVGPQTIICLGPRDIQPGPLGPTTSLGVCWL